MEIMEDCVQWNPVIGWKDSRLQWALNLGLLEQQASALPTELPKVYEAYVHTDLNLKVLIAHPFYDSVSFLTELSTVMPI